MDDVWRLYVSNQEEAVEGEQGTPGQVKRAAELRREAAVERRACEAAEARAERAEAALAALRGVR